MSTGSAAIPLLKAAPEAAQVAERLERRRLGWAGAVPGPAARRDRRRAGRGDRRRRRRLRARLRADRRVPGGVAERRLRARRPARRRGASGGSRPARASRPASARACSRSTCSCRSRRRRTARTGGSTTPRSSASSRFYASACAAAGVTPLIENVPPVLRMRNGGVYLTPVGGHWRDLQLWCDRVEGLRTTFDTSHAALFAHFAAAYPSLFGLASDDGAGAGALRRGARAAERRGARLRRARPARRGPALRGRRAGPRPRGAPARRARALHRRRDQRARPGALAGHEGGLPGDRARARRCRRRRPPARAAGCPWTRSTGRPCWGGATPCPRCSSCRSASAGAAC